MGWWWRRLPAGARLAIGLMLAPGCTCGSNGNYGCAALDLSGLNGGSSCSQSEPSECQPDASIQRPHVRDFVVGWFGMCLPECEPGWFDCDQRNDDGCESSSPCGAPKDAGPARWSRALTDAPLGLAICNGEVVYADGAQLLAVDEEAGTSRTVALLDRPPSGGIACDGSSLYVALPSVADGSVDGKVLRISLSDASATELVSAVEPARSVQVDDAGGVFWIARADAGPSVMRSGLDASTLSLLGVDEPRVDPTFVLSDGLWATSLGVVRHQSPDASVTTLPDAGALALLVREAGVSWMTSSDAGGGDLLDASFIAPRAIVTWGEDVFVATDNDVSHIPASGPAVTLATGLAHVADVAVDAHYVYFTTKGPPSALSRVAW